MPWPCILITPANRDARWLRRYTSKQCNTQDYHQNMTRIEDIAINQGQRKTEQLWPHDDPRWPTTCRQCDYQFKPEDRYQLFNLEIYLTPDSQQVTTHSSTIQDIQPAPIGAMWFSPWCPGPKKTNGPYLWVKTPGGNWCIDGYSTDGGPGWERTGEPPTITVTPSINCVGRYHGHLQNGILTDDCEGRHTFTTTTTTQP